MPELPEVEVVRRGLVEHVVGRTVADVAVHHPRAVRRHAPGADDLVSRLRGRRVADARRRGKYLWLDLAPAVGWSEPGQGCSSSVVGSSAPMSPSAPDEALVMHLGMSGQLLVQPVAAPPEVHLRVTLTFAEDDVQLRFVDQRTFGSVALEPLVPTVRGGTGSIRQAGTRQGATRQGSIRQGATRQAATRQAATRQGSIRQGATRQAATRQAGAVTTGAGHQVTSSRGRQAEGDVPETVPASVAHIARDPLDPCYDLDRTAARLRATRSGVKRALLDQTLVSGIGNIYADEALWQVGLHGERPSHRLSRQQARALLAVAGDVMRASLRQGGTSFDALYVDVNGQPGYFERTLAVYGRAGQPCDRCGTPIVRQVFMNRSSHSCPRCQPPPRTRRSQRGG